MNHHVNSNRYVVWQEKPAKETILFSKSALIEPTVILIESVERSYGRPTSDKPTKRMATDLIILLHEVTLCKHFALLSYTQVWNKMATKIFSLIHSEPEHSLWTEHYMFLDNII